MIIASLPSQERGRRNKQGSETVTSDTGPGKKPLIVRTADNCTLPRCGGPSAERRSRRCPVPALRGGPQATYVAVGLIQVALIRALTRSAERAS